MHFLYSSCNWSSNKIHEFLDTFDKLISMIHCLTKVLSFARTTILLRKERKQVYSV